MVLQVEGAGQSVRRFPVPALGGGPQPPLGPGVPAVLQQVGERVGAQRVPLLGGLAEPVLGGRLVPALPAVAPQRVRGGRGSGDGGDPPPAGGLVGIAALVEEDAQVVGCGTVALGGRGAKMGFGSVEVAAAQQHGPEDAHGLDVAGFRRESQAHLLDGLPVSTASAASSRLSSGVASSPEGCTNRPVSNRVALSPITSIVAPPATRVHLVYRGP